MQSEDEDDEFLFESSHLALRSNTDYQKLLRHLTVLCAQRIKIHEDIIQLRSMSKRAIEGPLAFVEDFQNDRIVFPTRTEIPGIPTIEFSMYSEAPSTNTSETKIETETPSKSQPVNFWTAEEQRKLEELLIKYPTEAVESQRFAKIAKEMGNRTRKQIASRVQKFFKKLQEANLPIPLSSSIPRNRHRAHKNFAKLGRPSTFFPERNIPADLLMKDESDLESETFSPSITLPTDVPEVNKSLLLLKEVRVVKAKLANGVSSEVSYDMCNFCNGTLFVESNWHCYTCSVRFCPDCLTSQLLAKSFRHYDHNFLLKSL